MMNAQSQDAAETPQAADANGLSLALFTALYELTMAQAYWQSGHTDEATFSLFIRRYPQDRSYLVFAGIHDILTYLEQLRFTDADIDYLRSLGRFDEDFLRFLSRLRFQGTVRAMAEGTIFFANEPVLEITAPVIEGQILENYVLNRVNLQTMLATKAARAAYAAQGRPVTEFGARRTPGLDAADQMARVGYMAGFAATGNVLAAARHGITPAGTMAHSFIGAFPSEIDAFRAYARSFPDTAILLIDTYDVIEGARNAITVAQELRERGHRLAAVRLDSGDVLSLSRRVRAMLDEALLEDVGIVISGELDEFAIDELVRADAPINGFGVGTKIGSSADAPWTDAVYKLVEYADAPVFKLSTGKETLPGRKQVYRRSTDDGRYSGDVVTLADEPPPVGGAPLLQQVMQDGRRMRRDPSLNESRALFQRGFANLPETVKALRGAAAYPVEVSSPLADLRARMTRAVAARPR